MNTTQFCELTSLQIAEIAAKTTDMPLLLDMKRMLSIDDLRIKTVSPATAKKELQLQYKVRQSSHAI